MSAKAEDVALDKAVEYAKTILDMEKEIAGESIAVLAVCRALVDLALSRPAAPPVPTIEGMANALHRVVTNGYVPPSTRDMCKAALDAYRGSPQAEPTFEEMRQKVWASPPVEPAAGVTAGELAASLKARHVSFMHLDALAELITDTFHITRKAPPHG